MKHDLSIVEYNKNLYTVVIKTHATAEYIQDCFNKSNLVNGKHYTLSSFVSQEYKADYYVLVDADNNPPLYTRDELMITVMEFEEWV